jgi:hypothetical protein
MARPLRTTPSSQYTDYETVDAARAPSVANDNRPGLRSANDNYPTTDARFRQVQVDRRTDPTRAEAKKAQYDEFMAAAAAREQQAFSREADRMTAAEKQSLGTRLKLSRAAQGSETQPSVSAQLRTARLAWWLGAWAMWVWLTFQLPFALLSLVFFGLQAVVDGTWVGQAIAGALGIVNSAVSIFGGNIPQVTPLSIGVALLFLVFGISLFFLLITAFAFLLTGQKPLFGNRATAKMGAFLLCLIGYAIPGLNLFPWIFLYLVVMVRASR